MYTSRAKDCGNGDSLDVGVASDTNYNSIRASMESEMELLTLTTDTLAIEITTDENNAMYDVHNGNYELNISFLIYMYIHINMQVKHSLHYNSL